MRASVLVGLLSSGIFLAGCGDDTGPGEAEGSLRVIQASLAAPALDVLVDGTVRITGLPTATLSSAIPLATGRRTIEVARVGQATSPVALELTVAADSEYTAVVFDSSAVPTPAAVTDTGAVPAPGMTKLQVIHMASAAGPIDVYRSQPDFEGFLDLAFPFEYRFASGYVQSTPGDWHVLVATESRVGGVPPSEPQDTLLLVGPVTLTADQAATVVLVDDPGGGIGAVIVRER